MMWEEEPRAPVTWPWWVPLVNVLAWCWEQVADFAEAQARKLRRCPACGESVFHGKSCR